MISISLHVKWAISLVHYDIIVWNKQFHWLSKYFATPTIMKSTYILLCYVALGWGNDVYVNFYRKSMFLFFNLRGQFFLTFWPKKPNLKTREKWPIWVPFTACQSDKVPPPSFNQWLSRNNFSWVRIKIRGHFLCNI